MKKIFGAVIRVAAFVLVLGGILFGLTTLTKLKESEEYIKPYTDNAEDYDVLFLGDSMVLYAIYPMEIWEHYGIPCYNLASVNCSVPMSYWRLRNALDYGTPKVVVVNIKDIEEPDMITTRYERVHTAFDGFPMTLTKLQTILDIARPGTYDSKGVPSEEFLTEMLFPLAKYHERWNSLTDEDLHPVYNENKGANYSKIHVSDPQGYRLIDSDACIPEEGNGYVYLRKIIELCQEKGISVIVTEMPHPADEKTQMAAHRAERITEEYGVPLLNFVDMDSVADLYTDCFDPGGHMNPSGGRKVTDYLGRYLQNHYDLPDRRAEEKYASWNAEAEAYRATKLDMIVSQADSLRCRLMLLHDEDYSIILTGRYGYDYGDSSIRRMLQNIVRRNVSGDGPERSEDLKPLENLSDAAKEETNYMFIYDRDTGELQEYIGECEQEFETSFGTVFSRMNDWRMDLSLTREDGEEIYYFESDEEQEADLRILLIDRSTGKPALAIALSGENDILVSPLPGSAQ